MKVEGILFKIESFFGVYFNRKTNCSEAFTELISNAFLPPLLLDRESKDTVVTFSSILKECIPLRLI